MGITNFFENLTDEQIFTINKRNYERNKEVYKEFYDAYLIGKCSLCGYNICDFISQKPCYHWFLRPAGIKKKHFKYFLTTPIQFFQFDAYLKWMANIEIPLRNINDLKSEMNPSKFMEYTIKYKNIEWTISISKTDKIGHPDTKFANFPHFHLQLKIDDFVFIKFNDFHFPLSKEDLFIIECLEKVPEKTILINTFGQGMSIIENEEGLRHVYEHMTKSDYINDATFETSTFLELPEGETIDGDILLEILNQNKETSAPINELLRKYYPNGKLTVEIRPSKGVPLISKRISRK